MSDSRMPPSNRRVFLDTDGDSKFETGGTSVWTGVNGDYSFTGPSAGNYSVRRGLTPIQGYRLSNIASLDVKLSAVGNRNNLNVGTTDKVLLSGRVYDDIDIDGIEDATGGGLNAIRV